MACRQRHGTHGSFDSESSSFHSLLQSLDLSANARSFSCTVTGPWGLLRLAAARTSPEHTAPLEPGEAVHPAVEPQTRSLLGC